MCLCANYTPYTLPYNNYFRKCFTCFALNLMIYADTAVSVPNVTVNLSMCGYEYVFDMKTFEFYSL